MYSCCWSTQLQKTTLKCFYSYYALSVKIFVCKLAFVCVLQYFCLSNGDHCLQWQNWRVPCNQHWGGWLLGRFSFYPFSMVSTSGKHFTFLLVMLAISKCLLTSSNSRINTPRKEGGLGRLKYPLLSDLNHQIAKDYGVLLENEGHTLRWGELFTSCECILSFVDFYLL